MDLDALRFGNFSQLGTAVTDWQEMVKNLKTLADDARDNLKGKADKANWSGVNAKVSREFIDKTAGEFDDAHTQANTIAQILDDTRLELIKYRTDLNHAIDDGLKKNLTVMDTGKGSFTVTMNIHPDRAAAGTKVPEHTQGDVDHLRDVVQHILSQATKSDTTAAEALRLIVDQAKYGFSDANYKDRDSAADAVQKAKDMAALLNKDPHKLTNTELDQINANFKKYGNDPLFAETFATKAGPEKILDFYAAVANPYQVYGTTPERLAIAKQLQKNLGITLGTATQSDSAAMQSWEQKMVDLGPQQLKIDDGGGQPRGFVVMSNLMRFGDYDAQFLNKYGDKLYDFDKSHNDKNLNLWISNPTMATHMNFWGKDDQGRDPMTGFLEALGHNPEASTQFFEQPEGGKDKINEHLQYLTHDRVWLNDKHEDSGYIPGQDALGHALEAATTGYAYDADPMAHKDPMTPGTLDRRDAATAGVMEQVVQIYGGEDGPKMLHDHPEIADSLGKMGSAYIDDIDYDLSGLGDHAKDAGDFPGRYAGRASFGNSNAINFLSVLGQNETSHGIVTAGQHLYTLSLLDHYPPTTDANYDHGKDALFMEAEARGILDHSRVQQAASDFGADSEDANKSLGRSAEWGKFVVGTVVGAGVAAIPLPGATVAGVAIAPIVGDAAGEALNTLIGQEIDKGVDGAESDPTEKAQLTSQKFYDAGVDQLGSDYVHYVHGHGEAGDNADHDNVPLDLKTAYMSTGSDEDDERGRPPYKD